MSLITALSVHRAGPVRRVSALTADKAQKK
jgi:hypothetical protein